MLKLFFPFFTLLASISLQARDYYLDSGESIILGNDRVLCDSRHSQIECTGCKADYVAGQDVIQGFYYRIYNAYDNSKIEQPYFRVIRYRGDDYQEKVNEAQRNCESSRRFETRCR